MRRLKCLLAFGIAVAGPVSAQDPIGGPDWNLNVRPDISSTTASVALGSNLIAVRCREGSFDVLFGGFPTTQAPTQTVTLSLGPIVGEEQTWIAIPGTPFLAARSARLARIMRAGGLLTLTFPASASSGSDAASSGQTYHLDLPPSAASLDQVLTACSIERTTAFDSLPHLSGPLTWRRQPSPEYPSRALSIGAEATVEVVCGVERSGRTNNCRVASSTRPGLGFESAAQRAGAGAQLDLPVDTDTEGRVVQFEIRFNLPSR